MEESHVSQDEAVEILHTLARILNRRALSGDLYAVGLLKQAVKEAKK
jgi:hypothetical protein